MLQLALLLLAFSTGIKGQVISDCAKFNDCVSCVKADRRLPGIQRFCGWHTEKSVCGEPVSIVPNDYVVVRKPFMCPEKLPENDSNYYTNELGRSLYSLVLAVENKDPTECLANSQPSVRLIKRYEVECDQSHNFCAAMLAVSKRDRRIFLVYKSSNMDKQLITEFIHIIVAQMGVWQKFEAGGGALTYFHYAFERLFKDSGMKGDLIKLKEAYPDYQLWCTGHSLGASLASMTALYLVKMQIFPSKLVHLVTFGEPRTGNVAFAQAVEENVKFRYRVVHRGDPVTNLPGTVSPILLLLSPEIAERQALFYRYLVYYNNDMKEDDSFDICVLSGDYACRNLVLANNPLDHTNYFNWNKDAYLSAGCKADLSKTVNSATTTSIAVISTVSATAAIPDTTSDSATANNDENIAVPTAILGTTKIGANTANVASTLPNEAGITVRDIDTVTIPADTSTTHTTVADAATASTTENATSSTNGNDTNSNSTAGDADISATTSILISTDTPK